MLVDLVIQAHPPQLDMRPFTKLQMMCTCSGKLCSCFELQILLLCDKLPLPLPSFFVSVCEYSGLQVSPLSFTVIVTKTQNDPLQPHKLLMIHNDLRRPIPNISWP